MIMVLGKTVFYEYSYSSWGHGCLRNGDLVFGAGFLQQPSWERSNKCYSGDVNEELPTFVQQKSIDRIICTGC